jgi:hypothetical protein
MRQKLIILVILGTALVAAPAAAITPQQFNCEKAVLLELGKMSKARGKCINKCVIKKQVNPTGYSCSPPFDAETLACTTLSEENYVNQIVNKCTGQMPLCGGYSKGFCSNDTSNTCDCDLTTSCTDSCGFSMSISCRRGYCSTTTTTSCDVDANCPVGQTCVTSALPKDPLGFAQGNIYDGAPSVIGQIDLFAEGLFLCRQKVCSNNGQICATDGDCGGGSCDAGDCQSDFSDCDYDGQCSLPKKCLARGRCSVTAQSCNLASNGDSIGCPVGETCLRWGRCTDAVTPPGSQTICFTDAACSPGETCARSATQTSRTKEMVCTQGVNGALSKLTYDIFNCERLCGFERDVKDGGRCQGDTSIKCDEDADCGANAPCQPTSCDHFAFGRCSGGDPADNQVCADDSDCPLANQPCVATSVPPLSATLAACRNKAFAIAKKTIQSKCKAASWTPEAPLESLPACGVYSHQGVPVGFQFTADSLLGFVSSAQDGQFKEDDPDLGQGQNMCLD